jgi:hypothetical protein
MVYPPGQTLTVRDGGLNLVSTQTSLPLIIGMTSLGASNTLYVTTDPQSLKDTLGHGAAVELALPVINQAGGALVLKTATTVSSSNSSMTAARISTSTGTLATTGTAFRDQRNLVTITTTGTVAVGKFTYSLDGGYTTSPVITIPSGGTYSPPGSGVTFTFTPGGGPLFFEAGDTFTGTSTAAFYNTTDLGTAYTAFASQIGSRKIDQVFFAGKPASASAGATLAASVATFGTTLQSQHQFVRMVMDSSGTDTAANCLSAFVAVFSDARVCACFGEADVVSLDPIQGFGVPRISAAQVVAERAAGAEISENLGRALSGALRGVRAITKDEYLSTAFGADDKMTTLRTDPDLGPGFYITSGYLKSASGSDFQYYDYGRTLDIGCKTIVPIQATWKNRKVRTLTDGTGAINPLDAQYLADGVRSALRSTLVTPTKDGLPSQISGQQYDIDLTNNVQSTRTLRSTYAQVPNPPVETVAMVVGFATKVTA